MSWLQGLRHRARSLLLPGAHARELDEEMRLHLELDTMQLRDAAGARRHFGNRTYYAEETRLMTWLGKLDIARQDLDYAWRSVRRAPGFTALVAVTLALGIGVNAATFTVLDEIYLRPPAGVDDPGSVRRIWMEYGNTEYTLDGAPVISRNLSFPMYREIATAAGDARHVAVFAPGSFRLGPTRAAPQVRGAYASASYFEVLGARIALGRRYSAAEDRLGGGGPVAVVSHSFWTTHLGGDSTALGRPIAIGRDEYTLIGVLDPAFTGIDLQPLHVWLPMGTRTGSPYEGERWWETNNSFAFRAIARLDPEASVPAFEQRASRNVRAMMRQAGRPDSIVDVHTGSLIEARGPASPGRELEIAIRLGGVAVIVLLIAQANVTNLLLARAMRRRREIAVRLALGISRWRLVRLLTLETVLVAAIAGVAAMVAGWWGGSVLRSLLTPGLEPTTAGLHWRVMLFTGAVAMLAGIAAGVVPAIQAANPSLTTALKAGAREGTRRRSRLRGALVIAQAALSVVLLVGAGLFVRSLHNVRVLDIGFDAERIVFGSVAFDEGGAPPPAVVDAAIRALAQRLEERPGVDAVARTNVEPMRGMSVLSWFAGDDSTGAFGPRDPTITYVSPGFFRATGIALLSGSGFSGTEGGEPPAEVVVNEAAARLMWPGRDPIGRACISRRARTRVTRWSAWCRMSRRWSSSSPSAERSCTSRSVRRHREG